GNGQDELVGLITRQNLKFEHQGIGVKLFGNELRECDTRTVRSRDLAIVPADRTHDGLVLELSAAENLLLGKKQCGASDFSRIPVQTLETSCLNQMREFDVRPTEPGLPVGAFSGGNQQKLILARELAGITRNGFILAAHPTRGVDLGAIEFIHRQLLDRAESGAGILLISSELSELFALCHKIYVLYKNELRGPFFRDPRNFSFDSEVIGQAMTGLSQKRAQVS
ncbi:MAG TPA: heme ABC transporter ATP-binding protein, partial [Oligoflexia bacterium]|nr:heme ABC transporter ATP-binding protein [Oligoflexia bacterium]